MRGLASTIAVVAALLSGCATGAAKPAAADARPSALAFYPLEPGWGWAYDLEHGGTTVLALYSVVERRAGVAVVQHVDERLEYELRPDGIARHDGGDYLLKSPVRAATAWPIRAGSASIVETAKNVTLPSGVYRDCATVEEVRRDPLRVTRTTFCRGVGPVEIEVRVSNPATGVLDVAARARLRSVSRP